MKLFIPEKKVHFSKGNLQYQASTNTWRFAEKQYDIIGDANKNFSASTLGFFSPPAKTTEIRVFNKSSLWALQI